MGITAMEDICSGLMKAGMDPDMPAAVLSKGTTAGQQRVVATVATLKTASDQAKIQTPAIIVVGKVCTLADDFAWYEKLPLAGWKILVTRPKENISRTAALLREKGAEVLELPSISIIPLEDQSRLYQAFSHIRSYDWLVFTSPAGVEVSSGKWRKEDRPVPGNCFFSILLMTCEMMRRRKLDRISIMSSIIVQPPKIKMKKESGDRVHTSTIKWRSPI